MARILLFLVFYFALLNFHEFVNVECDYNLHDFWNMKNKYRCQVKNIFNIDSVEKAQIDGISGNHMSGKSNADEIYFNSNNKSINHFPRGLEKYFQNIRGIAIWYDQLKSIQQSDLQPYTKLEYLNIYDTKIEIIEDGIFDFNPNLVVIVLGKSNIFHVGSAVFDHLTKLTSLYMLDNNCINKNAENDRAGVETIIKTIKSTCMSAEFLTLDEKFKNLENDSNLEQNLAAFESELNSSKFANFLPLNKKLLELKQKKNGESGIARNSINQNLIETCQNKEIIKDLHSSVDDIKTSQADILSMMDHKLSSCSEQSSMFNDKFTELEAKISKKLEDVEARIFEKMDESFRNLKKFITT